jgi:GT2 family glycosyltransferase
VVVVDNAVDAAVERLVGELDPGSAARVAYVAEAAPGVHNARHAGARACRAELLLFTDDDVVCSAGWVRAYADAFARHPELAAAGGPMEPLWEEEPPGWLRELADRSTTFAPLSLIAAQELLAVSPREFFYSGNMAIRREVLFALGGFDPEAFGEVWLGDGETGLNRRLWERGLPIAHVPGARVLHAIPAERTTWAYLRSRMRNEGAADEYARLHGTPIRRRSLLRRLLPATWSALRLRLAALRHRGPEPDAIWVRLSAERRAGGVAYLLRLLRDRSLWPLVERERWLEPEPQPTANSPSESGASGSSTSLRGTRP